LVQPAKILQYVILLLDARINTPPLNDLGGIPKKSTYSKFFLKKKRVNKWMQLGILSNKMHNWSKKGILLTLKVKKIINDGS